MRDLHRRKIICHGLQLLTAAAALPLVASRASAAAASCTEPESQPLRESLHYMDVAQEPAKACHACGFFTPQEGKSDEAKPADAGKHADDGKHAEGSKPA